jgi:hypothetical protein
MDASKLNRMGSRPLQWLLRITCLLVLGGCVTTSLLDQWRDPAYNGPALHKMLVVGVQRDDGARRLWEDGMVTALTHHGVQATASYQMFPNKAPNADELAATAAREGFDGVLASHFVAASQRNYWMPDAYAGFGYGWRSRYYGYWGGVYGPGFVESEHRADFQTDVYAVDPNGGKLIWAGITRSVDLSSARSITDQIGRVLVPVLAKQGIIAGTPR